MKRLSLTLVFCTSLVLFGCKDEKNEEGLEPTVGEVENEADLKEQTQKNQKVTLSLEPKSGSNLSGNVVFTEENGEVTMTAVIDGLAEGMHAIHLHENADCSADDASSAGGHWNPTKEKHGKWGEADGYHRGDIGNFSVDTNGNGTITFSTDQWCIGCEDPNKNILGKAVVIHDGVDDFTSQPSGDAGSRVGCGVIKM